MVVIYICDTIKRNEFEVTQMLFLVFYAVVLYIFNVTLAENPAKIGWLVPKIQAVEGFAKQWKTNEILIGSRSQNQSLQVQTHFAWLHHILRTRNG